MKRTVILAVLAVALASVIAFVTCGGSKTARELASTSAGSAATAGAGARVRDVHVDPRKQPRGSIAGTVTDAAKAPIAGARVCASWFSRALSPQALREPPCALSDAGGRYTIANLVAAEYTVAASARTFRPAVYRPADRERARFPLAAGETKTGVDLVLKAGGVEIRGTVADVTGGPIANALVAAREDWESGEFPPVETDAQGTFTMWVKPGYVQIEASAEGYTNGRDGGRAPGTFDILLTPESSVSGTVVDATGGEPVAGVTVEVEASEWSGSEDRDPRDITDEQGRFRVARLGPGRHVVSASSPHGFGRAEGSTLVGLGQHVDGVVVKLHPGFRIAGKVVLPDKSTCQEPWLGLVDTERERGIKTGVDPSGQVFADGVLPGTYMVNVRCRGFVERDKYPQIVIVDKDMLDQSWDVDAGATIRGRVVDKRGGPIADAEVMARSVGGAPRARQGWGGAETKDDGAYEMPGLRPGKYVLEVQSDKGLSPSEGWPVELAAGAQLDKDLVLDDSGAIAGNVVDSQGSAVGGITVRGQALANRAWSRFTSMNKTQPDGSFEIDNVRPGEYRVVAQRGWGNQLRKPGTTDDDQQGEVVTVAIGKTATVNLVVEAQTGVIEGTVLDTSGAPAPDAYVSAARESDAAGAQRTSVSQTRWSWDNKAVMTALDGTFALEKLSPGNYTVRAYRKGGGEALAEHVAVGSTARLQIRPTGSISGTVTSAAGAIDEMTLELRDPKTGFSRNERLFRTQGRFTLPDLPAGTFTLSVASSRGKKQVTVELAEGEQKTGVAVTLEGLATVTGRVVDMMTKQPVAGMRMLVSLGTDGRGGLSRSFDADETNISGTDGRFTIKSAPTGAVVLYGFPRDFRDSPYGSGMAIPRVLEGAGTIDVGDLPVLERRIKPGEKVGELGVRWKEAPPGTPLGQRTLEVSFIDPSGPAAKTALKVGDVVTTIDGIGVQGESYTYASTLMRAPPGTKLAFGLARGASVEIVLAAP